MAAYSCEGKLFYATTAASAACLFLLLSFSLTASSRYFLVIYLISFLPFTFTEDLSSSKLNLRYLTFQITNSGARIIAIMNRGRLAEFLAMIRIAAIVSARFSRNLIVINHLLRFDLKKLISLAAYLGLPTDRLSSFHSSVSCTMTSSKRK